MKLIYQRHLDFFNFCKVENFLQGRTQYALVEDLIIFHGCSDELSSVFRMGQIIDTLEYRGLDPKSLWYLCCYGSLMPDLIKVRHLYPVDHPLRVQLLTGGVLKVYDPKS